MSAGADWIERVGEKGYTALLSPFVGELNLTKAVPERRENVVGPLVVQGRELLQLVPRNVIEIDCRSSLVEIGGVVHTKVYLTANQVEADFLREVTPLLKAAQEQRERTEALQNSFEAKVEEEIEDDSQVRAQVAEMAKLWRREEVLENELAELRGREEALAAETAERRKQLRVEREGVRETFFYVADERAL
jgi:hypothetical protein